ncbi:hypothetical protein NL676_026448 [Syzygium grande]|nr:hypothetical protein NL676_026448 [Syzygium grande]
MAVSRRTVAIGVWFFCTCIGGEAFTPNVTMVSSACRGVQYNMHGSYDRDVRDVIADLVNETQYNAYNYYTQSTESGQVCYGHAASTGIFRAMNALCAW